MPYVNFYHYTDEDAVDSILKTGVIRGGTFTHFGQGVYGTRMPPSEGKEAIARNNWRIGWWRRKCDGRVDFCFKIRIPADQVEDIMDGNRHIYMYPGDLRLKDFKYKCLEVEEDWSTISSVYLHNFSEISLCTFQINMYFLYIYIFLYTFNKLK